MPDHVLIRPARPDDLAALPGIERAAAAQFRMTPYAYLADDDLVSTEVDLTKEYVWVAVDLADQPIGFALVHLLDESVHLHELDVHPDYARQGLGRQLIAMVADWARERGATALTLTTFDDVPWNGPYYARLGFRTLNLTTLSPGLQGVRQAEAEAGLPMAQRICMRSVSEPILRWCCIGLPASQNTLYNRRALTAGATAQLSLSFRGRPYAVEFVGWSFRSMVDGDGDGPNA
jgi:GNAT superfamily N-acetyltransferase